MDSESTPPIEDNSVEKEPTKEEDGRPPSGVTDSQQAANETPAPGEIPASSTPAEAQETTPGM